MVVWSGNNEQSMDLVQAIARNCTCEFGLMSVRLVTCEPHRMISEDQRALDGLLFMQSQREKLLKEEFNVEEDIPS